MRRIRDQLESGVYQRALKGLLLMLALFCLLFLVGNSRQAAVPILGRQKLVSEYSQNGGAWQTLEESTGLSALDGDLILRGRFENELADGGYLWYYRDHIGVTIYVNGELCAIDAMSELHSMGFPLMADLCGREWGSGSLPGIKAGDELEIHLHNPHTYGNAGAYRVFLDTLCIGPGMGEAVEAEYKIYSRPFQVLGWVMIAVAVVLLCSSAGAALMQFPIGESLSGRGLQSLFAGVFILFDSVTLSFQSEQTALNSGVWHIAMILFAYWIELCAIKSLTSRRHVIGSAAVIVSGLAGGAVILLAALGTATIYDLCRYWMLVQKIVLPVLLLCGLREAARGSKQNRLELWSDLSLLAALLLDLYGVGSGFHSHGTLSKITFSVFMVWYLARGIANIIVDYQDAARARKLERELEDSRIAIMLGQIQPHFIYNTLTSIYQLCEIDPNKAQQAIGSFSKYLRGNLHSLEQREPVPFAEELRHVETYLELERMRFGKRLEVQYHIEADGFTVPPLTVQTLVENAVKHGIGKKKEGGIVTVNSYETPGSYVVIVTDTGAGFDPLLPPEDDRPRVGLKNTQARLFSMCAGTLKVQSAPGEGTTATIVIPKMEEEV